MTKPETYFIDIRKTFLQKNKDVKEAQMMNAPGIAYANRVFAYYFKDAMVFKLGKDFMPENEGIIDWDYLNPYKNKTPMKAWFVIPYEGGKEYWAGLCLKAYKYSKTD